MLALARLGAYELLRAGSTTVVDYYLHPKALAEAIVAAAQAVADRQWRRHGTVSVATPPSGRAPAHAGRTVM